MKLSIIRAGALVALVFIGTAACSTPVEGEGGGGEVASGTVDMAVPYPAGVSPDVETSSTNSDNPPPRDIDSVTCEPSGPTGPRATGQLTNRSSGLSSYLISVNFLNAAGAVLYSSTGALNNIPAGTAATWEVLSFEFQGEPPASCVVVKVDRMGA